MLLKVLQQQPLLLLQLLCIFSCGLCIRPAFENDPELCPFTNRLTINGQPAEMTPKIPGMKYFRRVNESRENVTINKANSLCRLYNLEAAEILDQDDYNEVISIVKETGWTFWINLKGKYNPEYGRYNFEYTLADGYTKIGFHDFGPESYTNHDELIFGKFQEGCAKVAPSNNAHPSGVSWDKVICTKFYNMLCQYPKSCYRRSEYMKDPTRPVKRLVPIPFLPQTEESGFYISTHQATWSFAKQVCEDAGMQLLWFENNSEQEELTRILEIFAKEKVHYQGKSFWTAGRFTPSSFEETGELYTKLYHWKNNVAYEVKQWNLERARLGQSENSGGFLKKWGIEREATQLGKHEPYDEGLGLGGFERCVDASYDKEDAGLYYTSKCTKHLRYYICKKPEIVKQLGTAQKRKW